MSNWSYMSPQICFLSMGAQSGGIVPQTPTSHYKPPDEGLNSSSSSVLEEEVASSIHVLSPRLQRLDSSGEEAEGRALPTGATVPSVRIRDDLILSPMQGVTSPITENSSVSQSSVPCYSSVEVKDCFRPKSRTGKRSVVNNNSSSSNNSSNISNTINSGNISNVNDSYINNSNNSKSRNQFDTSSNLSASGCLSPPAITSTSSGAPAFPSEPTILVDKYIILGPVDASTSHAIHIKTHEPLHVKAVSPRTAREVCCQQSLLGQCEGVRAPLEAVMSGCGKRAWLVFPPHYGDLHSYVRLRRRLREAEAQRLFAQVASTVERCHAAGLVLRDLKLRKFVFTDSNRQQVVLESVEDSVVAGESDLLHDKHGCPAYVAPEILSASTYSGRYADMWGLGVILYTMLVGRYPFHNADTSTLFKRIRRGQFFIPEWVSSRARHLIVSLLQLQPHRRLNARQVLLHPWLNRSPRDHVGKDPQDHIVPGSELVTQHTLLPGKSRPS